nr:hypothetical protein [Pseudonocardia sp. ICBG601]
MREGLLNVLGAGISIVYRQAYPAPMAASLVLLAEATETADYNTDFSFTVDIARADGTGEPLGHVDGGWNVQPLVKELHLDMETSNYVPVIVPLDQLALPEPTVYSVAIDLKGVESRTIRFRAVEAGPELQS